MHYPDILHHGAKDGVTGSCHQLLMDAQHSLLIDCGLFQGAETSPLKAIRRRSLGRGSSRQPPPIADHPEFAAGESPLHDCLSRASAFWGTKRLFSV